MSTSQDNKERSIKIGSEEDNARCQTLEQEERAIIARGVRQHPSLSPTAKSVALYAVRRARPWWQRMFNDEVGHSIIIYSFAASDAARSIGVTLADVEKALSELVAAEVLGTRPNRFGKGRDVYFRVPWCSVEKNLAKYAGDYLQRRANAAAEHEQHDGVVSAQHNAKSQEETAKRCAEIEAEEVTMATKVAKIAGEILGGAKAQEHFQRRAKEAAEARKRQDQKAAEAKAEYRRRKSQTLGEWKAETAEWQAEHAERRAREAELEAKRKAAEKAEWEAWRAESEKRCEAERAAREAELVRRATLSSIARQSLEAREAAEHTWSSRRADAWNARLKVREMEQVIEKIGNRVESHAVIEAKDRCAAMELPPAERAAEEKECVAWRAKVEAYNANELKTCVAKLAKARLDAEEIERRAEQRDRMAAHEAWQAAHDEFEDEVGSL
jgi:hypothetical protein